MEWTIKEISAKTGISTDTLRYYDKLGIVSPKRHENSYRYYDEKDVFALEYISVMKYAQFSLADIKTIVGLLDKEPSLQCNDISIEIISKKIGTLQQMIINYQNIIQLMEGLLPMIDGVEMYEKNKPDIHSFIKQIFTDIHADDKTTK